MVQLQKQLSVVLFELDIIISLDSLDPSVQDKINGGFNNLGKTINTI